MTANKWKESLCLPRTTFPMRAGLARQEPKWLEFWQGADLYRRRRELRAGAKRFVLHDGPPYASGDIHAGTALNKILKDVICRYAWQAGRDTPYLPGWDCHGLPIEHVVLKELGGQVPEGMSVTKVRAKCLAVAMEFLERQKTQFARLGVLGEWEHSYLTVDKGYEAGVLECFRLLVEAGLVERAKKAVHWSWAAKTALAEAELEYRDREDPSLAVALLAEKGSLPEALAAAAGERAVAFAIWTTTPWTLPANVAVAVDPAAAHSLVAPPEGPLLVVATARAEAWAERWGFAEGSLASVKGEELVGARYALPFGTGEGVVVAGGAVSMEEGTGLVHTAPGHGAEDFEIGRANGLPLPSPVDEEGRFVPPPALAHELGVAEGDLPADLAALGGQHVLAANAAILAALKARGALLWAGVATHSYPHCWRTKEPVIFRATWQWFVKMDTPTAEGWTLRERALEEIPKASWIPPWGEARLAGMVGGRPDWCISRQRLWGIAIPAFADASTGEVLCTPEVVAAVRDAVAQSGSDVWFDEGVAEADLCPDEVRPKEWRGRELRRQNDIFDVWFESGSSHRAVLMGRDDLGHPADLYLEGDDQHRGWFQLSSLLSLAGTGKLPFRECLTHAFVVDDEGHKMSKSLGNSVDPMAVCDRLGADILRLWAVSADSTVPMRVGAEVLVAVSRRYRKLRNTLRFLLGVLDGFAPGDRLGWGELRPYDRWVLGELARREAGWRARRDARDLQGLAADIALFMGEASSGYLDAAKDRLYAERPDGPLRRAAQTACAHLLERLLLWLAPILPFTAEEAWQAWGEGRPQGADSVHLANLAPLPLEWEGAEGGAVATLLPVAAEARRALESAKEAGAVRAPLEASLTLYLDEEGATAAKALGLELPEVFGVSEVEVEPFAAYYDEVQPFTVHAPGFAVGAELGQAEKCPRCWKRTREEADELCQRCRRVAGGA